MDSPITTVALREHAMFVRRFELTVVDGPDRGKQVTSSDDELGVGTARGSGLELTDPSVSRHHCVFRIVERGLEVRDLGSTNRTQIGGVDIVRGFLRDRAHVKIGSTTLLARLLADEVELPMASPGKFAELLGASAGMRRLFALLERCAPSDATVLIHGETGTGKDLVAEAIHGASPRRDGPFVVVDCSALAREVAESELFGHVRGAFTGADTPRVGAFQSAHGGTLFLDEIGELSRDLQPLLLRALENAEVKPVGSSQAQPVDVRVIAASHRDLRVEVNARRFRSDLFYRLDVIRVVVPPLREREGDVDLLAKHFWSTFRPGRDIPAELLGELRAQPWPGNVRELRNVVERAALVGFTPSTDAITYEQARMQALEHWERGWIERLVETHHHNLTRAARAAGMGRTNLRRLVRLYGLTTDDD